MQHLDSTDRFFNDEDDLIIHSMDDLNSSSECISVQPEEPWTHFISISVPSTAKNFFPAEIAQKLSRFLKMCTMLKQTS